MTVDDLRDLLQKKSTPGENVMPFLLRFALGEFHYGQRATKLLPGQKPAKKDESSNESMANIEETPGEKSDVTGCVVYNMKKSLIVPMLSTS